jgi:hypothetical protein
MSVHQDRIGPDEADVVVFNKGGRDLRYEKLQAGEEAPREFFYGFLELGHAGYRAAMQSTSGAASGAVGAVADRVERTFAAFTGVGVRPLSLATQKAWFRGAKVAISYTDGFSLTLGLAGRRATGGAALIGGFHGLSDIEFRAPTAGRSIAHATIRRALAGLDHAFFFGPADREFAIDHYALARERTSIFPFGIDTEFWRPLGDAPEEDVVVAIGQDRNRDYNLLVRAPGRHPMRVITRQKLDIPAGACHVSTSSGDYSTADSMTDADVRRLYNRARAVIVPLKDVRQPSGYSVTLQAMSCGRPVILSDIKGLWSKDILLHGENCLLVRPGDADALSQAIASLRSDAALRERLGRNARATALAHFGLNKTAGGTLELARLGLDLHASRTRRAA